MSENAQRNPAAISPSKGSGVVAARLSDTERAIAERAARGLTNLEIARELQLSCKTVEWNLTKVYRAVGVRSRTELAALWGRHATGPGESPDFHWRS